LHFGVVDELLLFSAIPLMTQKCFFFDEVDVMVRFWG